MLSFVWEYGHKQKIGVLSLVRGIRYNGQRPYNIEWDDFIKYDSMDKDKIRRWLYQEVLPALKWYHSNISIHKDFV